MSRPNELHQIQAQLTAPQQQASLTDLYRQALRGTLFNSRSRIRPTALERAAAAETAAILEFFQTPDLTRARQHGVELCLFGLDEEAILRLGQVTRKFCLMHLDNTLTIAALETIDAYHSIVIRGFGQAYEARMLEEQDSIRKALHRTLARYTIKMELAAQVAKATTSTLELEEMLHVAAELVREHLNLYYVGIFLVEELGPGLDEHPSWAVLRAGTGEAGQEMLRRGHKLEVGSNSMIGWCTANAQPRIALDVGKEAVRFDNSLLPATRSELALPLIAHEHVIGAITVQSDRPAAFGEEDINILQATADQLASAIQNAQLLEQARTALAEVETTHRRYLREQWETYLTSAMRHPTGFVDGPNGLAAASDVWQPEMKRPPYLGAPVTLATAPENGTAPQRTALASSIKLRGESIGVLEFYNETEPHDWTNDERVLVEELADQAALALENARLFEETQVRAEELAVLNELSRALSGHLNVEEVIEESYRGVSRLMDTTNFYVSLYDAEKDEVVFPLEVDDGQVSRPYRRRRAEVGLTGYVILHRIPILIKENLEQWYAEHGVERIGPRLGALSWLGVPLVVGDRILGMLAVQSYTTPRAYNEHDQDLLITIASQIAIALQNAYLFEQTQTRMEQLAVLNEISRAASGLLESEQLLTVIYEQVQRIVKADGFFVGIYDPDTQMISCPLSYDGGQRYETPPWQVHPETHTCQVINSGKPVVVQRTPEEAAQITLSPENSMGVSNRVPASLAFIPMKIGERTLGVVSVQSYEPHVYSREHINLLSAIANQMAVALENARLFEQARRRALQLATASEAGRAASSILDLDELLQSAVELVRVRFGFYHVSVFLLDEASKFAVLRESTGDAGRQLKERGCKFAVGGQSLVGWVSGRGRSRAVTDATPNITRFKDDLLPLTRSEVAIPLRRGERVIGVLDIQSAELNAFSMDDVAVLDMLADQLSVAIQNARLYGQVREQAAVLEKRAADLAVLNEVSRLVTQTFDQMEILNNSARVIARHFGVVNCNIGLLNKDKTLLRLAAEYPDRGTVGREIPASSYPESEELATTRRPITIDDVMADSRMAPMQHILQQLGIRSVMFLPLIAKGDLAGYIRLDAAGTPRHFTDEETSLGQTIASQVAVALQNAWLYEEQKQTAERLREVDRLKTEFLANMSHELRTPLNSIIGFSRVILKGIDGPLTDLQKQDLEAIHGSGQHLLGLINDILDISKIEAGKMELAFEEVDLRQIIKGVMSSTVGLVKGKSVELRQEVPDDLPMAWADHTRARQVLLNLVSNAGKFTDQGSITIFATYDENFITLGVRDTGIGIPADKLDKIFEEFTQVDASTTRRVGGTGLGLAISRRFVQMHGGKIWVESQVGQGSTFYFSLPRAQTVPPEPVSEVPVMGRRTLLAVDDDPGVITLYKRYLEKQGYQVIGVTDSRQAVEQARRLKPDVITVDILMPNKDGWSVIQDLRQTQETRHIPVIVCSIIGDQGRGFSLGAADYLIKPITEDDLLQALKRLDGQRQTAVLVIDDRLDDVQLIRRILEAPRGDGQQALYAIREAHNGKEGIMAVHQHPPDLIILDLMMTGIDGFAVLEAIRSNPTTRHIPIIVFTAKDLTDQDRQRLNGQVEALLSKGMFTEQDLLDDVATTLKRSMAETYLKADQPGGLSAGDN